MINKVMYRGGETARVHPLAVRNFEGRGWSLDQPLPTEVKPTPRKNKKTKHKRTTTQTAMVL